MGCGYIRDFILWLGSFDGLKFVVVLELYGYELIVGSGFCGPRLGC